MLLCGKPEFVSWEPDLSSSGGGSPTWTKMVCDGVELCNSMELISWERNPVQVYLCEQCGYEGCAEGGYVHIVRLGDFVLWSMPQIDASDDWEVSHYRALRALHDRGAVLIGVDTWDRWRARYTSLPEPGRLPPARRLDVAGAWLLEIPQAVRVHSVDGLATMLRKHFVASTNMTLEQVSEVIDQIVGWVIGAPEQRVVGALRRIGDVDVEVEEVYLDAPTIPAWPAFARRGQHVFVALGEDWVLDEPINVRQR